MTVVLCPPRRGTTVVLDGLSIIGVSSVRSLDEGIMHLIADVPVPASSRKFLEQVRASFSRSPHGLCCISGVRRKRRHTEGMQRR